MNHIEQLVSVLGKRRVFIQTHYFPDPDAIASAYGLQVLLKEMGVDSKLIYDGSMSKLSGIRVTDYFDIEMHHVKDFDDLNEQDAVILIDAQKFNKNCTDLPCDEVACIDHHPTVFDCEYAYEDIRMVGAASTIVASYLIEMGIEPTKNLATILLYGIKMDTADFSRGVSELDVEVYYHLFPYVDHEILKMLTLNTLELMDLKAYASAINNISIYKNIGFACITFDCPDALIAIISDFILALDVVEFSMVYSIRSGGYKFSVRSELEELDAGKMIKKILDEIGDGNGGGHSFMAGGFLQNAGVERLGDNPRFEIERRFIKEIYPEDENYEKNTIRIQEIR